MNKIFPCLWFNGQALAAAQQYVSLFENSQMGMQTHYVEGTHQAVGSLLTVDFYLAGQRFVALNGGDEFSFTPAISFFVDCESKEQVEKLWQGLGMNGTELMPLQTYPFSEYYGWIQDQFGVSWQISLSKKPQQITAMFLFVKDQLGKAQTAMLDWVSIFPNSEVKLEIKDSGLLAQGIFTLENQTFRIMDSDASHDFQFSWALSLCIECQNQAEIDYYWDKLTKGGKEGPCGWLEDAYGVAWQIFPQEWEQLADESNLARAKAITEKLYTMNKIELAELWEVYRQFS